MKIRALRILPPLAIGRLGASPEPLENYDVRVDPKQPLAFRNIIPARTFVVDRATGAIHHAFTPQAIDFRDGDRFAKPVAPFLEVWADVGGTLFPLTAGRLDEAGVSVKDVEWHAAVGNHKVFRRTGVLADRVDADTGWFRDHTMKALDGQCDNFIAGKTLPLGDVQFMRPTKDFPEIRLRFTPAKGFVYGSNNKKLTVRQDVKDIIYDSRSGNWSGFSDADRPFPTNPGGIYANTGDARTTSRGYLDDECDGIVEVRIEKLKLSAFARIGAGPPDYAPDSFPVRTIADELEQMLLGIDVGPEEASPEWTEEIVRRAFETVRLQNTIVLNGNPVDNGSAANSMAAQDANGGRREDPIMAPTIVDNLALRALHQSVFASLRSGAAPWFAQVIRKFDEVGDLTDPGRRKMPAMMRGADGLHLALTRRQRNAIVASGNRTATDDDPKAATFTMPEQKKKERR